MKKSICVLLFSLSMKAVFAQWTPGPGNINNTNSGNVGIATNNALAPLHVNGDIALGAAVDVTNRYLFFQRPTDGYIGAKIGNAYGTGYKGDLLFETNNGLNASSLTEQMRILSNGRIGIGTSSPNAKLHIKGSLLFAGEEANLDQAIPGMGLSFLENTGQMIVGWNRTAGAGETDFISNRGGGGTGGFAFYNHDNNGIEKQLMWVLGNGQVRINTEGAVEGNHMLAVGGSIIAESVSVKVKGQWPDHVFKPNYDLPPLGSVKTFIEKNRHLPGIPSAEEVSKDGVDLGEMNKLLLKKVEELTLYLIAKDKQLKAHTKMNSLQNARIAKLERMIKRLGK